MAIKNVFLKPISPSSGDFDKIEAHLIKIIKEELYLPLIAEMEEKEGVLENALDDLITAIRKGRISYHQGKFTGKFSSLISKELKKLGAKWDKKSSSWKLEAKKLPFGIKEAIDLSEAKFKKILEKVDKFLAQFSPKAITSRLSIKDMFKTIIGNTEEKFQSSVKGLVVPPNLTPERQAILAEQHTHNLELGIQDFTAKETAKLREWIQEKSFAGLRRETMISSIQRSYGVTHSKAKFLARQEVMLLTNTYKETRYKEAGINEYKWRCVVGSPNHPVRPWHKIHDGKIFSFDNPPQTDEKGGHKNPGHDYNCRCQSVPLVKF